MRQQARFGHHERAHRFQILDRGAVAELLERSSRGGVHGFGPVAEGEERLAASRGCAKARDFEIWLMYVCLDSPERNVERVAIRVKKGGHAVPPEKVHDRYWRSLKQMPWFLEQADRGWLWDNSGEGAKLVGEKRDDVMMVDPTCPRTVLDALTTAE